jgi:hypothetical protein
MIINEEVYGNIATVYHRSKTPPDKFKEILEKNEWKSGIGAGNMYGPGLYTVFTKSSNNRGYGEYLYKMHVKGIKNFFIFLPEVYNKVWGTNKSYDEMIAEQNKRFKSNFYKYTDFIHSYSREHSKVAGIIFYGGHDGDVCLIFEPKNVIPVSYEKEGQLVKYEAGKINMSKEYKSNAFNHGGDIVDYLKKDKELINKFSEGNFIKCSVSDYNKSSVFLQHYKSNIFYVRKFKKITSLNDISNLFGSNIFNMFKKYFDLKSFGIYDNYKQLLDVIYFNGRYFSQYRGELNNEVVSYIAKKALNIDCDKISSEMERRRSYNNSKKQYEFGDSHFTTSERSDFIKTIQLPEKIKDFCKVKYADANKNVYDFTNKIEKGEISLEVGFYKNGKKATGEDKKALINKFKEKIKPEHDIDFNQWIKYGSKIFSLNLVTGKVSQEGSNNIAKKIANFLEAEIAKTNFIKELNTVIVKRAKSFIKGAPTGGSLNKKVKNVDYKSETSSGIIKNRTKENIMKAKMNREKQEREQQGKYIGKHQYDALKSVETYFNY